MKFTNSEEGNIKKYEKWAFRLFTTWTIVSLYFFVLLNDKYDMFDLKTNNNISNISFIVVFVSIYIILTCVNFWLKRWYFEIVLSFSAVMLFFLHIVYKEINLYTCIALILFCIMGIMFVSSRYGDSLQGYNLSKKKMIGIILFICLLFIAYTGTLSVLRYMNMKAPSYDFGIFSQMFHYMRETFAPMTTCERDKLLSHFAVHVSPAVYLLLPIYCIFPSPVTILVLQILILASSVIPLYLICQNRRLSNFVTACICGTYLLYPAMQGGIFYDFHENKLLGPLILWLIYSIERRKKLPTIIFTILTLMVKEDAALYVACIMLYYIVVANRKRWRIFLSILLALSCIYFFGAITYLSNGGDGAMTGRFGNFLIEKDDSLITIIVNVIKNPAFFFSQLMTVKKLEFLLWTILPLAFVPFMMKKMSAYILFIPYLLMNIMSNYVYQHDIFFQYTYGSTILLFMMVIIFFSQGKKREKGELGNRRLALIMICSAAIMCTSAITSKSYYIDEAKKYMNKYNQVREAFEIYIPDDASVEASSYYVAPLSARRYIYHIGTKKLADYIVYDLRIASDQERIEELQEEKEALGYEVLYELDDLVRILISPNAASAQEN